MPSAVVVLTPFLYRNNPTEFNRLQELFLSMLLCIIDFLFTNIWPYWKTDGSSEFTKVQLVWNARSMDKALHIGMLLIPCASHILLNAQCDHRLTQFRPSCKLFLFFLPWLNRLNAHYFVSPPSFPPSFPIPYWHTINKPPSELLLFQHLHLHCL